MPVDFDEKNNLLRFFFI